MLDKLYSRRVTFALYFLSDYNPYSVLRKTCTVEHQMIFAVDGGGTTFKTCLVDDEGKLSDIEAFPLQMEKGIEPLQESLNNVFQKRARESRERGKPIRAIGIGCRGIIDSERGVLVTDSGIMNFFSGHAFRELIDTDLPLGAENDAVAATMGENRYGIGKTTRDFILLTLGTGIGGGIIARGAIYKGKTGMGGHLGHFPVNPDGVRCGCGNVGCVEREFSAGAFEKKIVELNAARPSHPPIKDVAHMFDAAANGDNDALRILKRGIFFLARAISGYANALDPEFCVLSGGMSLSGDFLLKLLREELRPVLWLKDPEKFVVLSGLKAQMGLYGAGAVGAAKLLG